MGRHLVHIEFANDADFNLARWYGKVMGWTIVELPQMYYATGAWSERRGLGAGFTQMKDAWPPGTIIPYFESENLEADIVFFTENGAEQIGEVMHVPEVGAMAYFKDPEGNIISLLQPVMGGGQQGTG